LLCTTLTLPGITGALRGAALRLLALTLRQGDGLGLRSAAASLPLGAALGLLGGAALGLFRDPAADLLFGAAAFFELGLALAFQCLLAFGLGGCLALAFQLRFAGQGLPACLLRFRFGLAGGCLCGRSFGCPFGF
jgi:hypothetical protein